MKSSRPHSFPCSLPRGCPFSSKTTLDSLKAATGRVRPSRARLGSAKPYGLFVPGVDGVPSSLRWLQQPQLAPAKGLRRQLLLLSPATAPSQYYHSLTTAPFAFGFRFEQHTQLTNSSVKVILKLSSRFARAGASGKAIWPAPWGNTSMHLTLFRMS